MASQAHSSSTPQQQERPRPPGIKRLLVIASAVTYVLLLGVPVWWHTTSLHRPPLPHEAMQQVAVQASSSSAFLPVTLQLVVVLPGGESASTPASLASDLHSSVQAAVVASTASASAAVQLSVTVVSGVGACQQHPTTTAAAAAAACSLNWSSAAQHLGSSSSLQGQPQQLDHWLQQQQPTLAAAANAGQYSLYLLPHQQEATDSSSSSSSTLVVGRHRHAWLTYEPAQLTQQPQGLQSLAAAAAVESLQCCFGLHAGPTGLAAAGSLPISPSGHTHLSFSLLNAGPAAAPTLTWDMEDWEAQYLTPVTASLAPLAQLSVESQVLQYTAARLAGQWSEKHGAYVVKGSQLPFFIDSEWALESGRAVTPQEAGLTHGHNGTSAAAATAAAAGSGGGRRGSDSTTAKAAAATAAAAAGVSRDAAALVEPHVLQFVVYVPPQQHRPLQLLGRKGRVRDSNSYTIPSWGGLLVLNPTNEPANSSSSSSSRGGQGCCAAAGAAAVPLTAEHYQHITAVVIAQLQSLFGVAVSDSDASSGSGGTWPQGLRVQQLPAGRLGFSGWQVDALLRQRSAHDVREAARVLAALSTLVQELPNLEMPDLIGEQVAQALSDIDSTWRHTAAGNYTAAAAAATAAHAAAEAAFSHPAVLAQLNFPDSHKLGVYMPLFLPLCVPLVQGLTGQLLYYGQQRRRYWQLLQASTGGG